MSGVERESQQMAFQPAELVVSKQQLARRLLRALAVVAALAVGAASYSAYVDGVAWQISIYVGLYVLLLVVTFRERIPYQMQVVILILLFLGFAAFNLLLSGVNAESFLFLLAIPLLGAVFFERRGGWLAVGLVLGIVAVVAWLFVSGRVVVYVQEPTRSADLGGWLSVAFVALMMSVLLIYAQDFMSQRLGSALTRSRDLAAELQEQRDSLQNQVVERTKDLERRTRYLEATAEVARETSSVLDLEQLLGRVVTLISDRFVLYRIGVFLLDSSGEEAVLRAASGAGGVQLLNRRFRVGMDGGGIVAHVIRSGQPYVASDVSSDPLYLDVKDVADTRSELTLPLRARGKVLGALSVQSPRANAFGQEDISPMQTLADQVALAISNAQLFQQAQEGMEAERRAYGRLSRQAWLQILRAQPDLAVLRDEHGLSSVSAWLDTEVEQALQTGQSATGSEGGTNLAVPVRVRGQIIGAIDAHKPKGAWGWTSDQIALLEALADQLGDALEDARLYRDVQRRAAREQLVGEVTARMRETLDVDAVLRAAAQQMRQALGLHDVTVRLERSNDPEQPRYDGV
jgi:GAF domain-containing protein